MELSKSDKNLKIISKLNFNKNLLKDHNKFKRPKLKDKKMS
jgi:hypothetical protein